MVTVMTFSSLLVNPTNKDSCGAIKTDSQKPTSKPPHKPCWTKPVQAKQIQLWNLRYQSSLHNWYQSRIRQDCSRLREERSITKLPVCRLPVSRFSHQPTVYSICIILSQHLHFAFHPLLIA